MSECELTYLCLQFECLEPGEGEKVIIHQDTSLPDVYVHVHLDGL